VYFQTYRLALQLALNAQQAYRFELCIDASFVTFDYWDDLKKGLLAGENLAFSLAQMEAAYLAANTRELEIERTVSLALWQPHALWDLKTSGSCSFDLSEELFDYDYPSHYKRQIKSVALSVPAVIGPYQNLKATLTQTYSGVAVEVAARAAEYLMSPNGSPPASVREQWAPKQQVALSRGVNDAGLFVLDFHDERYLPFEGTGAVSKWTLSMPRQTNRFDLDAISDVIVTVRYTALDGGASYQAQVEDLLASHPLPASVYVNLAQACSLPWATFMNVHSRPDSQTLSFELDPPALGFVKSTTLTDVFVKVDAAESLAIPDGSTFLEVTIPGQAGVSPTTTGGIVHIGSLRLPGPEFVGGWTFTVDLAAVRASAQLAVLLDSQKQYLDPAKLESLELILNYDATVF
jgi:hypothetical protein